MNFVYAQDEPDKSVSFIPSIYAQSRPTTVNGGLHKIKLESYNDSYSQNLLLNSDITCPHSNSQALYSNFPKEVNGHPTESESPLKFSGKLLTPILTLTSSAIPNYIQQLPQMSSRMPMIISTTSHSQKTEYRSSSSMTNSDYHFNGNSVVPSIPVTGSSEPAIHKHQCLNDLNECPQQSITTQKSESSLPTKPSPGYSSSSRTAIVSEALFVRIIVSKCKRIAPLWFRGISSMRERNREENRRTSNSSGQTQNDWSLISGKIKEMNQALETDTVVNLLKKLYKELPGDSVLKFIKCWLSDPEALSDADSCVLSRADAKGRMRRIDGGKGSDKVWRLDTIVGMLFHGLPMSSTDTNIMVHTCNQELCVRPQHIRFRASSVALVIVLKALEQAGYAIIPPRDSFPHLANSASNGPQDEAVDVFGPFSIEELQRYRSENLTPAGESVNRVTLNSSDRDLTEAIPLLKRALHPNDPNLIPLPDHSQLHMLNGGGGSMDMAESASLDIKPIPLFQSGSGPVSSRFPSSSASTATSSSSTSTTKPPAPRRSLKRQAPTSGDPSSSSSSITPPPPSLQSEFDPSECVGVGLIQRLNQTLPDPNIFLMQQQQQQQQHLSSNNCIEAHQGMEGTSGLGDNSMHQQQQLPTHFTTQPASGNIHQVQPLYAPQAIGGSSIVSPPQQQSNSNSLPMNCGQGASCDHGGTPSGKSTPRQPAKKRLEARTPTIENVTEAVSISAFKVLHDTPFTPVRGSGQQQQLPLTPSGSTNSGSVGLGPGGHSASVAAVAKVEEEDEEMKKIFLSTTRRHHSTVNPLTFDGLPMSEMKHLQTRLAYQQQHAQLEPLPFGVAYNPASATPTTTKRCASASAVGGPNASPLGPSIASPPPRLTPALAGGGVAVGYDGEYARDNVFSTPPPPSLGRQSATKPEQSAVNRAFMNTPDGPGRRDLASQIRDSPIAHTHPEIIEVLVSLAQEYGIQPNRSGSSCSRPRSNFIRSFFPGSDSPSPAGFTLNLLSNNMGGNNSNANVNNNNNNNNGNGNVPSDINAAGEIVMGSSDGMEQLRTLNITELLTTCNNGGSVGGSSNGIDNIDHDHSRSSTAVRLNKSAYVFPPSSNFDHR